MNILLTGCAGFIGSHVLDRLLADGHTVVGVDNFDAFYARSIKEANIKQHQEGSPTADRFTLIESDLGELASYDRLNRSHQDAPFDAIIHLAAKAGVRPSIENPVGYLHANVLATQYLLDFAQKQTIQQFVFASSSSVYGVCPELPWKESNTDLQPISPYAGTKLSCELLGKVYSHIFDLRFLALRFFTVYGPRQRPDLAIHKFTQRIANDDAIPVFGDGSTSRDYTYIDDIVSGILAALDYRETTFEIFNIGNDQTVTLSGMISQIEETLGVQSKIERLPEQQGDVPRTWACIEKSKATLGYQPTTSFPTGIKNFADWFLSQKAAASS